MTPSTRHPKFQIVPAGDMILRAAPISVLTGQPGTKSAINLDQQSERIAQRLGRTPSHANIAPQEREAIVGMLSSLEKADVVGVLQEKSPRVESLMFEEILKTVKPEVTPQPVHTAAPKARRGAAPRPPSPSRS